MPPYFVAIKCYEKETHLIFGHLHSKIPLSKKNFLTPFKRGVSEGLRNWMKLDANSGMILLARHFIAEPVFIVFVHFKA